MERSAFDFMRKISFTVFIIHFAFTGVCQYRLDAGVYAGASKYLGDIGGKGLAGKGLGGPPSRFGVSVSGFARYNLIPPVSIKINFTHLRFSAYDNLSADAARRGRNLHFKNKVFEFSTQADFNYWNKADLTRRGKSRLTFIGYVFAGFGGFYHNPKAFYKLKWYALQPLGTEGQGRVDGKKKYRRLQAVIPFGTGFYFTYNHTFRIGMEFGYRKTFTDYLDDISTTYPDPAIFGNDLVAKGLSNRNDAVQDGEDIPAPENYSTGKNRGYAGKHDSYFIMGLSVAYVIKGESSFYLSKYGYMRGVKARARKMRSKY